MKTNTLESNGRMWRKCAALGAALLCAGLAQTVQSAKSAQPAHAAHAASPVNPAVKDDRAGPKAGANGPLLDGPALTRPSEDAAPALAEFEGKRDPFKLPPPPSPESAMELKIQRPANLPPGPRGLIVGDLKLEGVVSENSGHDMIAVVTNGASDRAYFLSENEQLYDGQVTRIGPGAVYFTEKFFDQKGHETVRPVVKSLAPGAGEGR